MFKRYHEIDFSREEIKHLKDVLNDMHEFLRDYGFSTHSKWVTKILSSVIREDSKDFQRLVLAPEFIGGAGSICDIQIRDDKTGERFDHLINTFLNLAYSVGLRSKYLKSRIRD
tara:strand:- start:184 stop:525 length:342 start_codon:yes stop_codon:yes gene_type:complete